MKPTTWEITASFSKPVMFCAHVADNVSEEASYAAIKELVNRAKKEKISIYTIYITVDEEGTTGTLAGTRDLSTR